MAETVRRTGGPFQIIDKVNDLPEAEKILQGKEASLQMRELT